MPATKKKELETSDYPAWWDWDSPDDGDVIEGTFVRAGKGFTAHGERTFVTLEVDGIERTLWLHWTTLSNQFAREVHRRPDKTIHAGEHVVVRRLGERTSGNGRDYINFETEFPDGPQTSQADLFRLPETPAEPVPETVTAGESAVESGPDDDVPF